MVNANDLMVELQRLLQQECYSSAELLGGFLLSASSKTPEALGLYGDALYGKEEFRRALTIYQQAQNLRKSRSGGSKAVKSATASTASRSISLDEVTLRLKMAKCHLKLNELRQAVPLLEGIPPKARTLEVHLALGKLYQQAQNDKTAIVHFKEALRMSPYALEAYIALGQLGADSRDFCPPWLQGFAQGHAYEARGDFKEALLAFHAVESTLSSNATLLAEIGKCLYFSSRFDEASFSFEKARSEDPALMDGMDIYANVLHDQGKLNELSRLCSDMMEVMPRRAEPWVACALLSDLKADIGKAIAYAEKAVQMNDSNVCAHLVRGKLLLTSRPDEAVLSFKQAYALRRDIITSKGLVEAFLNLQRAKEAWSVAKTALVQNKTNPLALVMMGMALSRNEEVKDKAAQYFQKALSMDPSNADAAVALADFLIEEGKLPEAIELLKRQLQLASRDSLCVKLAQVYTLTKLYADAIQYYHNALRYD
mmetsp:Transcript_12331/g.19943  ORF Transcript_12331/g.19943 Transcript_12331/m.19943 type:complete len:483 (-) Transcript_12331:936-2384(-)